MPRKKQSGKSSKARVVATAQLPTGFGSFRIFGIEGRKPGEEAVAIQHGTLHGASNAPPRTRAKRPWCASTRNASPATSSPPNAAIAARNWNFRSAKSPRNHPACCCIFRRKAAASD